MICCENCFYDAYLIKVIKDQNIIGNCDFCGSRGIRCIDCDELTELFLPIAELYVPVLDIYPAEILKEMDNGDFLWDKLNYDWEIFNDLDLSIQEDLTKAILPSDCMGSGSLDSLVESKDGFYETSKSISAELMKDWEAFCDELKYKNRFFVSDKMDLGILNDLFYFLRCRLETNETFYRSRISNLKIHFKRKEMGKPPREKSVEGRANPKGISYLYLASDQETSIAEVKPLTNDYIIVGKFIPIEPLSLIDLRNPRIGSPFQIGDKLRYFLLHLDFLRILGNELSKPINLNSEPLEYLPLQYLCEFIKNRGYDGVLYSSSLAKGFNIAIFNDNKLECVKTSSYTIKQIQYQSERKSDKNVKL